jgi:ribonuclease BN (tRNA processing enzyme)
MRFLPLGVGDAFSELYYSSCMAVEANGRWFLIDCPHPVRKMLREASLTAGISLGVQDIAGVILTHLHADHASGLESLGYFSYFLLGKKMPLLVHPMVSDRLWEGHLAAGMEQLLPSVGEAFIEKELTDYFELVPLSEKAPTVFEGVSIECRPTIHHIPTTALRLTADGVCLGHSADTAFDESLLAWLSVAELFIHETNYGVHTPYEKLATLPAALRNKMRLTHYPDTFEANESVIEILRQGELYEIPSSKV